MAKSTRKSKKSAPKSRAELRKEKRLKKKENKRDFFSKKSKTLKGKTTDQSKQNDDFESEGGDNRHKHNSDNEIDSDFDLSDDELNAKLNTVSKKARTEKQNKKTADTNNATKNNPEVDRFLKNQQKEKQKQKELERKMRKQRITQLTEANEEETKVIKKLEKQLRINKHTNEKSVHKMFSDGLDYAMELCLPENVTKMYSAAKEAAKIQDIESEDEFQDDFAAALDDIIGGDAKPAKNVTKSKKLDNIQAETKKLKKNQMILKQVENKYFKDEDSDLSDADSELEASDNSSDDDEGTESEDGESYDESDDDETKGKNDELNGSVKHKKNISPDTENDDDPQSEDEHSEINDEQSESDAHSDQDEKLEDDDDDAHSDKDEKLEDDDDDDDDKLDSESDENPNSNLETATNPEWEDIYGRKRDAEGNILKSPNGKYIPPHLRAKLESEKSNDPKKAEKLDRLKRQVKGLLNRLAEANMVKISKEIENLYRRNSRYDMNNVFTQLIMEALITNVLSKERMVLEYAMLIAILHVNIGNEISAHILQEVILKFDDLMQKIEELDVEDKELDNTVLFISHVYTYKIFQHSLIFEILNRLVNKLCEKSVECILVMFRSVGFQMRKDDPLALRDAIFRIQTQSNEIGTDIQNNSRYKFMIEILTAIKNNNMQKIPQYDPSLAEHLKKILKNMFTSGKYLSTLNITMEDLLNADKKGKWWVVGSAWSGNITDIGVSNKKADNENRDESFSEQLLQLAKQQRMNTDDRRNIFCVIMSSEDYLDAFEKLLRLSIKDVRLIVSIIIHCCLSEKNFNPYYVVLAEKFCLHDRKYFLAVQFAIWDKIKDIDSLSKQQAENLGKFILYLVRKGAQPISILKVIEFTELNKTTLRFVRKIILALLLGDKAEMIQVFKRIAPSVALNQFKNAIMLFIRHFLLKGSEKSHVPQDKMELLNDRIDEVEAIIYNRNFL